MIYPSVAQRTHVYLDNFDLRTIEPSYMDTLYAIQPASPGHIQISSLMDRWHFGILGGQLEICPLTLISLVWHLCELNGQQ